MNPVCERRGFFVDPEILVSLCLKLFPLTRAGAPEKAIQGQG